MANLDVDYAFFNQQVWPDIAQLVPSFENIKVVIVIPVYLSFWPVYATLNRFSCSDEERLGGILRL